MKSLIFFIVSILSFHFVYSQSPKGCFNSKTDVNSYLSSNSSFEKDGLKISFSEMGGVCTTGSNIFMNPNIVILNSNTALLSYTCVSVSGYKVTFLLNCSNNTLTDKKDNTIYNPSQSVWDLLEQEKNRVSIENQERYNKFHSNEKFNQLDLTNVISTNGQKISLPLSCEFYYKRGRDFYSMKPTSGGYIIDSNLYDSKDKLLGTIKNGIDFYYIDFINEWDQKSRMYINKVDQMYENVVEKRTYTVGMINLKKNEREGFTYLDHLFVDCNSDKLCILTGAIQMIKWHTREKTPIELLPDQIFIDTNYVNSIKGNNSHIVPFKSFHISSNRYYTKDGNTWYQDEQLPWTKSATYEIYSVDDKNLYLRQLTYNSSPVDPKSILIVPINVTTERNKYMTYPYYLGSIKTGYTPYSSYETYLDSNDVKYTENTVLVAKPKNSQVNSSDVVQDGIKVTYRKEGDLESRIEYKNGVMNGVYERYYQGNLEIKGEMNNGVIVGRWEYYIDVKGNYLNGKLDKKQSGIYENGKKVKNL